jgi:hypothetical protein
MYAFILAPIRYKAAAVLACCFLSLASLGQAQSTSFTIQNQVIDVKSGIGLAFVNIGIPGKNKGTVSDEDGRVSLSFDEGFANDTLQFSCIGFESVRITLRDLRSMDLPILMEKKVVKLEEIVVLPKDYKEKFFGHFTHSNFVQAGFSENVLGKECGVLMRTKKPTLLEQVQINFANCSYDSVYFRLNVYQQGDHEEFVNILEQPIVLAYSKQELAETLLIDLLPYQITVNGSFMLSVEYIKDLGIGSLNFKASMGKRTYVRGTSQGAWEKVPVGISLGVFGQVEK